MVDVPTLMGSLACAPPAASCQSPRAAILIYKDDSSPPKVG